MSATRVRDDRVTAIIVNYRTPDLALACAAALARERDMLPGLRIIMVDGGSGDGSAEAMSGGIAAAPFADLVTLLPLALNGGFGWANNQGIRLAMQQRDPADFVYLVNPDATIEPGAITPLVTAMHDHPHAAAAGSLLLTTDGRELGSAFSFPSIASEFFRGCNTPALERFFSAPPLVISSAIPARVDWVTGASVLLRATALREAGLFDDGFFLYFEEVELMHRLAQRGWTTLHVPASRVLHVGGAATGVADGASQAKRLPTYWFESRRRYFVRTRGRAYAAAATLAWIAGFGVWRVRELLGFGRASGHAPRELHDLLRVGIVATPADRLAVAQPWDDSAQRLPAWQRHVATEPHRRA